MIPLFHFKFKIFTLYVCFFKLSIDLFFYILGFFMSKYSFSNKLFLKYFSYIWMLWYFFVHKRLRERRLIKFIMSESPVTNDIHNYILFKLLSEFSCNHTNFAYLFNMICIYMENWCSLCFSNICAIKTRSTLNGISCKTDLIVSHNMNCTSCFIIR